jgi:hypothetical protein
MLQASPVDPPPPPALEVRAEGECPRAEDVAAALNRMLGDAGPSGSGDVAELRENGGAFVIVLRSGSGEVLGEKRLPATLECPVRAEMAAVSIAAMEAQLGGDAAALPAPAPPLPAAVEAPPRPVEIVERAPPTPPPRAPLQKEVGAAFLASMNGTNIAPGARLELALGPATGKWALVVAGLYVSSHSMAVEPGEGSWWRVGGELGVRGEVPLVGGATIQPGIGVAVTALSVDGHGFARNTGSWLLDPGVVARLRLVPVAVRVRPWLEVAGVYWPRAHVLTVSGRGGNPAELPAFGLVASVGWSFGGQR